MKKLLLPLLILAVLIPSATPSLAGEPEPELSRRPRWQQLFPPVSPPVRTDPVMAYDTARGVAVLFGGYGDGSARDDTWEWDSQSMTWTERLPAHRPPARTGAALVYDRARGVTVLFGGKDGFAYYNDTWLWDGTDWTQVFPVTSPEPRWLHGMVYDSRRQVTVVFGGLGIGVFGTTWEWDGTNWVEQAITSPSLRFGSGMAYDSRRRVTVLFGGDEGSGFNTFYDDTWERAGGGDWVKVRPESRPPARERTSAAYFPELRRVFIFGGLGEEEYLNDTWAWNGGRWSTQTFDPRPSGRCCTAIVYDPILRGLLLFGGSVSFVLVNDTWLFR